jgi:hypothetical protein
LFICTPLEFRKIDRATVCSFDRRGPILFAAVRVDR